MWLPAPHRVEVLKYTAEELLIRQRPGYGEFALALLGVCGLLAYAGYEAVLPEANLVLCALLACAASICAAIAALALLETRIHMVRATGGLILTRRFLRLDSTRRIPLSSVREVRSEPAIFQRAALAAYLANGQSLALTFPPVPGDRFWLDKLALDLTTFLPRPSTPHPTASR